MSFKMQYPTEILKDATFLAENAVDIFKGTVKAGAEKAADNMRGRSGSAFGGLAGQMNQGLRVTKPYITRKLEVSSGARYYGYVPKKDGGSFYLKVKGKTYGPYPGIPRPLIATLTEYGPAPGSKMPEPFQRGWKKKKHPFVRPAFSDTKGITAAMEKAQKELSKGLLE